MSEFSPYNLSDIRSWGLVAAVMLHAGVKAAVRLEDLEPIPEDKWPDLLEQATIVKEVNNGNMADQNGSLDS